MKYVPIIGLEVHIELSTSSKMFCACPAEHFLVEPNSQTCPVCLGLPGALPYANSRAIESCIKLGLALGCDIAEFSKFDRKHYFYPDLPKSYQISQYDLPFCFSGKWKLSTGKTIGIRRIHMEEDTAKLVHGEIDGKNVSQVDFNRSGVPLVEMVTEPDFEDVAEVDEFLREIKLIVRYLGISTADMEKGSMRLEANVSLREETSSKLPPYKVELKNINSFKFLAKAISAELTRQEEILKQGEVPSQETRGYDEDLDKTFSQRSKEDAMDYRYFPEPDIPPIKITKENIDTIQKTMPMLPNEKRQVYRSLGLPDNYIEVLVSDISKSSYFDEALKISKGKIDNAQKLIAGVMINQNLDSKYKEPAGLIKALYQMQNANYASESQVVEAADKAIFDNQKAVEDFKNGKTQVIGFLIGQVQKILKGSGETKMLMDVLKSKLEAD